MALTFDTQQLKDDLIEASITALEQVAHELGDLSSIGGFCLFTNDGAMSIGCAFASRSFLDDYPEEQFNWMEWPIEQASDPAFNRICDRLADYVLGSAEPFASLKTQILSTMTHAAMDVRQLLFPDNQHVIFIVDVRDNMPLDPKLKGRIEKLNPPPVYEQYLQWEEEELEEPY